MLGVGPRVSSKFRVSVLRFTRLRVLLLDPSMLHSAELLKHGPP